MRTLLAVVALASCGGSSGGACSVASAICAKACECGGSAGCAISVGGGDGGFSATITAHNRASCEFLFSGSCSARDGGVEPASCEAELRTASCVQANGHGAVALPASCGARASSGP